MSNVATIERPTLGIIATMADRYGMDPRAFEATLRATVVPQNCSKEQFAAFLLVAKEYGLNPVTKEIYAFPGKGGGIQPVVSIDGWMNLCNSHPQMDGLEFDDHLDEKGNLVSVSARIWRKDRSHPTVVTEYMAECKKDTEPWNKWGRRMLRHKAAIQCARYTFGFAGIIDPDEAERMGADVARMRNVTPVENPAAPATGQRLTPPPAPKQIAAAPVETHDPETGEVATVLSADDSALIKKGLLRQLEKCNTSAAIDGWNERSLSSLPTLQPGDREDVLRERNARAAEVYDRETAEPTDDASFTELGE